MKPGTISANWLGKAFPAALIGLLLLCAFLCVVVIAVFK